MGTNVDSNTLGNTAGGVGMDAGGGKTTSNNKKHKIIKNEIREVRCL